MKVTKQATVTWKGSGLDFSATLGSGYTLDMSGDANETQGSPMEMLLAGVAGCTAVDIVFILQRQRQPVSGVEVAIEGTRADDHPKVYTDVRLVYLVSGDNLDPKAVERAVELSEEKYCSASIMFRRAGVNVTSEFRILPSG